MKEGIYQNPKKNKYTFDPQEFNSPVRNYENGLKVLESGTHNTFVIEKMELIGSVRRITLETGRTFQFETYDRIADKLEII